MSELQKRAVEIIEKMPENKLKAIIMFMNLLDEDTQKTDALKTDDATKKTRTIGIARGVNLCAPNYDFDEYNSEIAKMFGVLS